MKNIMTDRFQYYTQNGEKTVILFSKKVHGDFLVEVINSNGMCDKDRSYKFDTIEEATKKFNSIKKRVANKIV